MTPRFSKKLKACVQSGKVLIHTNTTAISQHFCEKSKLWTIETSPPLTDLPQFDHVYFATGAHLNVDELDMLQTMHRKHAVETYGGLPALTDDLKWCPDVPMFLTGKLATLQIGPGAANLEGARLSAERIAWAIDEMFEGPDASSSGGDADGVDHRHRYFAGIGGRFDRLKEE